MDELRVGIGTRVLTLLESLGWAGDRSTESGKVATYVGGYHNSYISIGDPTIPHRINLSKHNLSYCPLRAINNQQRTHSLA